ncbi:MAG: OB-fold domain-containing protein [Hydrogenophilaceae bacterium]|jgi:hypothetical protein|nr:OB-fold domain-containing protein [Hydrogenophilaceae bacterium]
MAALLPYTADRETGRFFEAAAEGKLVFRACNACNHALHPPTAHCPYCQSWDTGWRESNGVGRLHAWTVVAHQIHPAFPAPYTLVVVELEDAPEVRLMGRLDGAPALHPGQRMQVWFEKLDDGAALPQWRPASEP